MDIMFSGKELEFVQDVHEATKALNHAIRLCEAKGVRFSFKINDYASERFDTIEVEDLYVHRSVFRNELEEMIKANKMKQAEADDAS